MKWLFKRILSVFLIVIMLFGTVPLAGFVGLDLSDFKSSFAIEADAIEASDLPADFDLAKYNVETVFSSQYGNGTPYNIFYDDISKYSCSKVVYNAFALDADFAASVEAWEAIRLVSNPSHITEYLEYQQQYEEIIFAVLFSALKNQKYADFSYTNMLTEVTAVTDNLLSTSRTAELLDKTSLDGTEANEIKDIAFAFLTNGKDVESKWSAFGDYTTIVSKCSSLVDKGISTTVNAANIVTSTVMYVSMLEQGAEILTYLTDLKAKSPNSVFDAAVSTVINTLCQDWIGVVEKTIIDSGFVICMEATDKLFDYAWAGCCAMCPFLGGMAIGEVIGTLACNILFSTEDLIEQYEYLKIVTQLETAACSLYQEYGNSCKSSVNSINASKLMFATDFSYALYNLGAEAAVEMMNIGCNKGIVNKVANIFGEGKEEGFDEFEESVESCVNSFGIGYSNLKSYWKFFIEEDYPEFFTYYEDDNIAPKHIESIIIEKDEVTFRVGEIMNFRWTVNPIDYEGGIGLKSDNEAVIKSREPMDILTYATEDNTGTANVTIYSLNNPEICDTIKITVIGENDEGTTEADSKYVTGKCGDNLTWVLNKNTGRLTIAGSGTMYDYSSSSKAPWYDYIANIKNITIGNSVTTIGNRAFEECVGLTNVTIGNSVITIGDYAFCYCTDLMSISIPNSVTSIGEGAFVQCYSLERTTISDSVVSIGVGAFAYCESLTSVTIPDSVTSIGHSMFLYCDSLTSVIIPDSITDIGNYTFCYCESLTNAIIPTSVISIGEGAFGACESLTNVTIPASVISIGDYAFGACESLTNVTIPTSVTRIGEGAFAGCGFTNITIPESVTSIGTYAFSLCDNLNGIIVDENNKYYSSDEYGALFNKDKTCLIQYPKGNMRISYIIPDSVTSIGDNAFYECGILTSIAIPDSVTSIGHEAFSGCAGLTSVTIPDSVTSIGDNAFFYCVSLTSITIPDSVMSIGSYAFSYCESLTSITISDGVINVGAGAFCDCYSLKSITIPNSIKSIGDWAFDDCESMADVYYTGSEEEWCSIAIGEYNICLTEATIHYNSIFLVSVSVYTLPSKTTYCIGDTLDASGLILTATYSDSSTEKISSGFTCTPTILNAAETQEIVVTYDGKKATFNVKVENQVAKIEIDTLPSKTVYCVGDTLDSSGLILTATYSDGSTEKISSGYTCDAGVFGKAGTQTITVSYVDKTTAFDVSVEHPYGETLLESAEIDENQVANLYESGLLIISGTGELTYPFGEASQYIKTVRISNGITGIGDSVFEDCYELAGISIPNSVTSIGDYAFSYCDSLTSITIPDSVTDMGDYVFSECDSLTSVKLSDSLTGIGEGAFAYCDALTDIMIPDNVTSIGLCAFGQCESITNLTIPDSVTSIDMGAFVYCYSLNSIIVNDNNKYYSSDEYGVLFNKDKSMLIQYPAGNVRTNYIIPDSVTNIGILAFNSCENLINVTISDSVINVDDAAFYDCESLTTITIPDSVMTMGEEAFYSCDSLESVTIGNGIKSIDKGAFRNCKNLTDVYYAGTEEKWNAIAIGSNNTYLTDATIHYNYKINEHEHSYSSLVTTNATCTQNGVITYTCDCGDSYTETIPSTGHTVGEWEIIMPATCIKTGLKQKKCTVCGTITNSKIISLANHVDANMDGLCDDCQKISNEYLVSDIYISIATPETRTVSYMDSIKLYATATNMPEGYKIIWRSEGEGVSIEPSYTGKDCTVTSTSSGNVVVKAYVVDTNGKIVTDENGKEISDSEYLYSDANLWLRILYFFKKLFGITSTATQLFEISF